MKKTGGNKIGRHEIYYEKVGNRYKPIDVYCFPYRPAEGYWKVEDNSQEHIAFLGEFPKYNIPKLATMTKKYRDEICRILSDSYESFIPVDIANSILKLICSRGEK